MNFHFFNNLIDFRGVGYWVQKKNDIYIFKIL